MRLGWIGISVGVVFVGAVGAGAVTLHRYLVQQAAIKQHQQLELAAAKSLAVKHTQWTALKGIHVTLNEPVYALTWDYDGQTHETTLAKPAKSIWLNVTLPQDQQETVQIAGAETVYKQTVPESWNLSGKTFAPLAAITDPGIWELGVSRKGPYTIRFNAPVQTEAQIDSYVSFQPQVAGHWTWINSEMAFFQPDKTLPPTQQETMVIHGGTAGPESVNGQYLASDVTRPFITHSNEKIVINEKQPETLKLIRNGKVIFKTLCNTGIPGAVTPTGTFYVRSKFRFANMRGTEPNGQPYFAPHVPWVMGLFGNVAIHGYPRSSYGFPQSVGCAELPVGSAHRLYNLVQVGTPVEIVK